MWDIVNIDKFSAAARRVYIIYTCVLYMENEMPAVFVWVADSPLQMEYFKF